MTVAVAVNTWHMSTTAGIARDMLSTARPTLSEANWMMRVTVLPVQAPLAPVTTKSLKWFNVVVQPFADVRMASSTVVS